MVKALLALATLLLASGLLGCSPPYRLAADGYTRVPLEGLDEDLPKKTSEARDRPELAIRYDSLYVDAGQDAAGNPHVGYYRFWESGQVLARHTFGHSVTASDGDVIDDYLGGRSPESRGGGVGRYAVSDGEIYINEFVGLVGGWGVMQCAGRLTKDGFVLYRRRNLESLGKFWEPMPRPVVYKCVPVGQMSGKPTW